ncbi:MAG: prolipoprotein diacylglyceryl transferase, partial [Eubacteriaceae bacterium]|nr:prolipoprotein diacylglyceryl transferase [Eubacteriaceae bacterium]
MHLELFRVGPVTIYSYGFLTAVGYLLAVWIGNIRAKKLGLNPDIIFNISLIVLVFGYVGSKILYYITILPQIIQDPSLLLNLSNGFVMYGGIVGGLLSGYVYCKMKKVSFLAYFDVIVVSLALAQSVGRLGCLMAGCCYGKPTALWFGITFPSGSLAPSGSPL